MIYQSTSKSTQYSIHLLSGVLHGKTERPLQKNTPFSFIVKCLCLLWISPNDSGIRYISDHNITCFMGSISLLFKVVLPLQSKTSKYSIWKDSGLSESEMPTTTSCIPGSCIHCFHLSCFIGAVCKSRWNTTLPFRSIFILFWWAHLVIWPPAISRIMQNIRLKIKKC